MSKAILTVTSFKGGTAKTSTTLHLGAAFAKFYEKKVLLVDCDAQANLSLGLGFDPDHNDSIAPVLQGKKTIETVILPTSVENLFLVPADTWLERVEVTESLAQDRYSHERLQELLKKTDFDIIIIDTPPSLCWLTESALIAATHALICATPEFYSVKGLERLALFIATIAERHPVDVLGVILSFWNSRGKNNKTFLEVIEGIFPKKCFSTKIRRDIAITEASVHGKPLFDVGALASKSRATDDFKNLAGEVLQALEREVVCL